MSVNQEEDVFCFKCVFLCFKQNREQYRNWKLTYTDVSKNGFFVQNDSESGWSVLSISETCHSIKWLSMYFSHYPGDNYCLPLPHKHSRSVVHSANTEPLTAVQHTFCKWLYTEPTGWVSINTYCKALQQITCHRLRAFLQFVFFLVQLLAGFVLASRAAHNNQHFCVFPV